MKKVFLNLGKQPITNNYLKKISKAKNNKEFFYHLKIIFDTNTKLVSLKSFVPPKKMFNSNYAHRASMSLTMNKSFKMLADKIKKKFNTNKVLEIGSNDGVFIKNFNKKNTFAVEPCKNLADITNKMGFKTYPNFWNIDLAKKIKKKHGTFSIIFSANTISHIQNLNETFKAVKICLDNNGVFIIEDPYILSVIKNCSYDQFYDEHAHVFSYLSLQNILTKFQLKIFNTEETKTHGGSMRYYIAHSNNFFFKIKKNIFLIKKKEIQYKLHQFSTYKNFAKKVKKSKNDLVNLLKKLKKNKCKIASYGATYKSSTVYNYCKIDNKLIDFVIDSTPNKQHKFMPGSHLKILPPKNFNKDNVDYGFLGAWNFKKEIINKERNFLKKGGKFITHVPRVHIIKY